MTVVLETQALTKYFGETHAVDRVDFRVAPGEVLALIATSRRRRPTSGSRRASPGASSS
jgi:ABC-type phosphonate transport system ATPase subunit